MQRTAKRVLRELWPAVAMLRRDGASRWGVAMMLQTLDKARAATAVAGMLEWYDFSIFGLMAVEIGANFFAEDEEASSDSLMATLGVFGGGFVARPLGGIIFGHMGDVGYGSAARGD